MWNDEQVRHLELAQTVDHPDLDTVTLVGQPLTFADDPDERGVHTPSAPRGAHTDSVLRELGYDDDEIAALHERNILWIDDDQRRSARERTIDHSKWPTASAG